MTTAMNRWFYAIAVSLLVNPTAFEPGILSGIPFEPWQHNTYPVILWIKQRCDRRGGTDRNFGSDRAPRSSILKRDSGGHWIT
jgi:hypothetical protein